MFLATLFDMETEVVTEMFNTLIRTFRDATLTVVVALIARVLVVFLIRVRVLDTLIGSTFCTCFDSAVVVVAVIFRTFRNTFWADIVTDVVAEIANVLTILFSSATVVVALMASFFCVCLERVVVVVAVIFKVCWNVFVAAAGGNAHLR